MNADEKRKVFEELLEGYQDYIESEFSYDDGEREAERKAWLNKYDGIKEPLIKDEKIRKAVRAWAEAECITKAYLENDYTICRDDAADVSISFYAPVFKDVGGTSDYTIAELCGEEEE